MPPVIAEAIPNAICITITGSIYAYYWFIKHIGDI
jgi:hypothetical protein